MKKIVKITKAIGYICITYSAYILTTNGYFKHMEGNDVIERAANLAESPLLEVSCIGLALLVGSYMFNLIKNK